MEMKLDAFLDKNFWRLVPLFVTIATGLAVTGAWLKQPLSQPTLAAAEWT